MSATVPDPAPPSHDELVGFYDESYAREGEQALLYSRWRALGALGKADHVVELCARAGVAPASTLDVGCGDGALLSELRRRNFGGTLHGVEITKGAVEIAGRRPEIDSVRLYDGRRLDDVDGSYDLGIVSHVLEHVTEPAALLGEVARACRAVVVEVPLEDNMSARRPGKREHAEEVGHLQRLGRESMRTIVRGAGLEVACELDDPLPLSAHVFFATSSRERALAVARWGMRSALHRIAPSTARRLFTVHYACLCLSQRRP